MTSSPILITTAIPIASEIFKSFSFVPNPYLDASVKAKETVHYEWDSDDWVPTYSVYDIEAEWSQEEIDYLLQITIMREDFYYKAFDVVDTLDIPFGCINLGQREILKPFKKPIEAEVLPAPREGLKPHEPYPESHYSDRLKALAYVNKVLQRRIHDFVAIARSLLAHSKRRSIKVYLPGDGCGLGAYVFYSFGFVVVAEEPSSVMRSLQKNSDIQLAAYQSLSLVVPDEVLQKSQTYRWDHVKEGLFRYDVSADYYVMSHIRDYVSIEYSKIPAKWVSFEHRIFDVPDSYPTVYAPNGSVRTSHPNIISFPLTVSDRVVVTYPVIFKEVFCRYKVFKLYEGTLGEMAYLDSFNIMRKFKYLRDGTSEDPVLHVVKNTPIVGFKAADTIWHTMVGREVTEPIARVTTSLLNNLERASIGIPFEFYSQPFLGHEFQFLPPSGKLIDTNCQELVSEPVNWLDPQGMRFVKVKDKTVYRYMCGNSSRLVVAKFVPLNYKDATFEQWLTHTDDHPMPYHPKSFMYDQILYTTDNLVTDRRMVKIHASQIEFCKAIEYGDIDKIREIISAFAI